MMTDDEKQIALKAEYASKGFPPSFLKANLARLQAVLGETKVSELEYDKFTRSAVFMTEWLTWALGVYRRFDPLQPPKPRRKRSHLPAERRSRTRPS